VTTGSFSAAWSVEEGDNHSQAFEGPAAAA
jgi:hypothetical protein